MLPNAEPAASPNLRYYYPLPPANPAQRIETDVCVYGATSGGVAAAIQARRMGQRAVLLEYGRHVGGLTSGGLSSTDIGTRAAIGGIADEFYRRLGTSADFTPSEAERAFLAMLREAGVPIHLEHRLKSVEKVGNRIVAITLENGNVLRAKVFIDATYEGDLLAQAGVAYHVGREANAAYGETLNGIQFRDKHNFEYPCDPYIREGDPASGLLWGISSGDPGKAGEGDRKIQAYNFRMFLSDAPDRIPFPKPRDYDPKRYALLARYLPLQPKQKEDWQYAGYSGPVQLRNGDCNNSGPFSTDNIGRNYEWPEGDYATRQRIFQDHVSYQQGLMYFLANDPRVPSHVREKAGSFGLAKSEFPETGGWPHQLYIREGRRMVSTYVMTEHNCRGAVAAEDSVGLASFNMDSHNCQRVVLNGRVCNEGDVQVWVAKPYPVAYRAIIPRESECANLIVPVCLSASHIAYGSIRMEPVFMVLGQSAATAAALAIAAQCPVQQVEYAKLKERLLADKQVLRPDQCIPAEK